MSKSGSFKNPSTPINCLSELGLTHKRFMLWCKWKTWFLQAISAEEANKTREMNNQDLCWRIYTSRWTWTHSRSFEAKAILENWQALRKKKKIQIFFLHGPLTKALGRSFPIFSHSFFSYLWSNTCFKIPTKIQSTKYHHTLPKKC